MDASRRMKDYVFGSTDSKLAAKLHADRVARATGATTERKVSGGEVIPGTTSIPSFVGDPTYSEEERRVQLRLLAERKAARQAAPQVEVVEVVAAPEPPKPEPVTLMPLGELRPEDVEAHHDEPIIVPEFPRFMQEPLAHDEEPVQ